MRRNSDETPSPRRSRRTVMSATTATRPHDGVEPGPNDIARRPGPLGRIAGVAYRHRGRVVLAWLGVLALAFALSATLGGTFKADYSAPGSDSQKAQQLLASRFPAESGDTVDVVIRTDQPATSPATRSAVSAVV